MMKMHKRFPTVAAAAALAASGLFAMTGFAHADGHRSYNVAALPAYAQECGACHVPYPPAMLAAASWQRLMDNLPRHFGTDASLDAPAAKSIANWLVANAAQPGRDRAGGAAPPGDRITQSAWFIRKHREVTASEFRQAAVRSPSNCSACHPQAAQGDFNEHRVRIPR